MILSLKTSAQDPDQLDPQDFGFLDPNPDPQKYGDPRIRTQGVKYQPKTTKKIFTPEPHSKLWNKEIVKISSFLNGSSSFENYFQFKKNQ